MMGGSRIASVTCLALTGYWLAADCGSSSCGLLFSRRLVETQDPKHSNRANLNMQGLFKPLPESCWLGSHWQEPNHRAQIQGMGHILMGRAAILILQGVDRGAGGRFLAIFTIYHRAT